jgi:hypothetical protein
VGEKDTFVEYLLEVMVISTIHEKLRKVREKKKKRKTKRERKNGKRKQKEEEEENTC